MNLLRTIALLVVAVACGVAAVEPGFPGPPTEAVGHGASSEAQLPATPQATGFQPAR